MRIRFKVLYLLVAVVLAMALPIVAKAETEKNKIILQGLEEVTDSGKVGIYKDESGVFGRVKFFDDQNNELTILPGEYNSYYLNAPGTGYTIRMYENNRTNFNEIEVNDTTSGYSNNLRKYKNTDFTSGTDELGNYKLSDIGDFVADKSYEIWVYFKYKRNPNSITITNLASASEKKGHIDYYSPEYSGTSNGGSISLDKLDEPGKGQIGISNIGLLQPIGEWQQKPASTGTYKVTVMPQNIDFRFRSLTITINGIETHYTRKDVIIEPTTGNVSKTFEMKAGDVVEINASIEQALTPFSINIGEGDVEFDETNYTFNNEDEELLVDDEKYKIYKIENVEDDNRSLDGRRYEIRLSKDADIGSITTSGDGYLEVIVNGENSIDIDQNERSIFINFTKKSKLNIISNSNSSGENVLTLNGGIYSYNTEMFDKNLTVNIGTPGDASFRGITGRILNVHNKAVNLYTSNYSALNGINSSPLPLNVKSSKGCKLNLNVTGAHAVEYVDQIDVEQKGEFNVLSSLGFYQILSGERNEAKLGSLHYKEMNFETETFSGPERINNENIKPNDTTFAFASNTGILRELEVSKSVKNGKIKILKGTGYKENNKYNIEEGTKVTIELTPDAGCKNLPNTFKVNGSIVALTPTAQDNVYTFPMPNTDAVIDVQFEITKISSTQVWYTSGNYNTIKIAWNKIPNVDGYYLYRSTGGAYSYIGNTPLTSYNATSLKTGQKYYYKVRAYKNINGTIVLSDYSNFVRRTPSLTKPTNRVYKYKSSYIRVRWNKVSGATGYKVYRKQAGKKWQKIKTLSSSKRYYTNAVKKRTKYYYKVRAYRVVNGKHVHSSYSPTLSIRR